MRSFIISTPTITEIESRGLGRLDMGGGGILIGKPHRYGQFIVKHIKIMYT